MVPSKAISGGTYSKAEIGISVQRPQVSAGHYYLHCAVPHCCQLGNAHPVAWCLLQALIGTERGLFGKGVAGAERVARIQRRALRAVD